MGSFTRFTRYVKDFWKVFIRGENDDLRRQTLSMEEELARLRSRRLASEKAQEVAALNQARDAVQKVRELHDNLIAAEQAAAAFAAKLGEAAKSSMEAHKDMREEACKKFFEVQKQQMLVQRIAKEEPSDASPPHLIGQENDGRMLELKSSSRAADDKDIIFAGAVELEATAKRVGEDERRSMDGDSLTASNTSVAIEETEFIDDVPPEALAQMLEEAKRQVQLEEKSHIDALSRNKMILEKEIEAREIAARASKRQG